MEDSPSQLKNLLKIVSVAGIFVSLVLGLVSAIWFMLGAEFLELLILLWGTLFLGVPMFGVLYALIKLEEYLHDIRATLEKSD